jgi:CrcB protein
VSVAAWIALAVAGGLGALTRFAVDGAVSARAGRGLPLGTLAVNLSAAFALGVLSGADVAGDLPRIAGIGFLGAYSTFSTWMLESHRLAEAGEGGAALLNLAGSLVLGLGAAALGRWLGGGL